MTDLARIDLRDYHLSVVGTGKKSGRGLSCLNPWRTEQHNSFAVYSDGWKDFATGDHGGVLDYVMRLHDVDKRGAFELLDQWSVGGYLTKLNIHARGNKTNFPSLKKGRADTPCTRDHPMHSEPPAATWQRNALAHVARCEAALWSVEGAAALAYLHGRGLTDDTIRAARLGYDRQRQAIAMPWLDSSTIWAVKFRHISQDAPDRYTSLTGSKTGAVYGVDDFRPGLPVVIVEGEFKALVARQVAGDLANFVSVGSVSNRLPERYRPLIDGAPVVVLVRDNDPAGERAARDNALRLPPGHAVLTVPEGKSADDYVLLGGDLRGWLTAEIDKIRLQPITVSDGVRSAALNCKLDAALIFYELATASGYKPGQPFTLSELSEAAKKVLPGIADRQIERGANQALMHFATKSRYESDQEDSILSEDSNPDFVGKFTGRQKTACRPATLWSLLPGDQIKTKLRVDLAWRLLEKFYPQRSETLPALIPVAVVERLAEQIDGLTPDEQHALADRLAAAAKLQNEVEARSRYRRYTAALKQAYSWLDDPHSTTLPTGWINGAQYRAIYLRAKHEADDRPRSYAELALMTGMNGGNVKGMLDRAGLKCDTPAPEVVALPERSHVFALACRAAKGRGKVIELVGRDASGNTLACRSLDDSDLDQWAASLPEGSHVAAKIQGKARQVVTGPVQPPVERRRPAADQVAEETESPNAIEPNEAPAENANKSQHSTRARKAPRFTGPGLDPAWLRDLLILAYRRLNDNPALDAATLDSLTPLDAAQLVLLSGRPVTTWIERSDPDRDDDPPDDPMNAETSHERAPDPVDPGATLYEQWRAFSDLNRRDDWYQNLDGVDREDLIVYKSALWKRQAVTA